MRRVVITGLGLLTSIGNNVKETWDNLISTKSGIKKITILFFILFVSIYIGLFSLTECLNATIPNNIAIDQITY